MVANASQTEFRAVAISLLNEAGMQYSHQDIRILTIDLTAVAEEFTWHDALDAPHAARVLRGRIGGISNLESYMRCLRVHYPA